MLDIEAAHGLSNAAAGGLLRELAQHALVELGMVGFALAPKELGVDLADGQVPGPGFAEDSKELEAITHLKGFEPGAWVDGQGLEVHAWQLQPTKEGPRPKGPRGVIDDDTGLGCGW